MLWVRNADWVDQESDVCASMFRLEYSDGLVMKPQQRMWVILMEVQQGICLKHFCYTNQ